MEAASETRRRGPSWRLLAAIVIVILAAIFMLQNSDETTVKFFFWTVDVKLIFGLLFAFALGLIIGLIGPRLRHD